MGEPWVKLERGDELAEWNHFKEVAYNQANRQRQKHEFYINAFDYIKENNIRGDYYEFGCHRARTFRMALTEARKHSLDAMQFLAFDSFEGLPKFELACVGSDHWMPGHLKTAKDEFEWLIKAHGIYVDRVQIIKIWFDDLVVLAQTLRPASIITVDCDLEESARPVFEFIEPVLQEGTLIYVDDYFVGYRGNPYRGVAGAFHKWERNCTWKFAPHCNVGWWGKSFIAYK